MDVGIEPADVVSENGPTEEEQRTARLSPGCGADVTVDREVRQERGDLVGPFYSGVQQRWERTKRLIQSM